MTKRSVHYERAFEDYLRSQQFPYIAVDETRRPLINGTSIKNMDFVVYSPQRSLILLVDVKGKQFPYRNQGGTVYWENWVGEEDLASLFFWSRVLGASAIPLLLFNYWVHDHEDEFYFSTLHTYRDRTYGLVAVLLDAYYQRARVRSPRWKALYIPRNSFLEICKPLSYYLRDSSQKVEEMDISLMYKMIREKKGKKRERL